MESQPLTVRQVIFKQARPILRRGFLAFTATAILFPISTAVLSLFFPYVWGGPWDLILEGFAVVLAVYAGAVYLRGRSHMSTGLAGHSYVLGFLGFVFGGFIDAYAGAGFLSLGYWLRQARKDAPAVCGKDGGEVVVFGRESLACPKCSKVVRVGLNVPRSWTRAGMVLFLVGIVLYVLSTFIGVLDLLYLRYAWTLLFFDGLVFLMPLYEQRMLGGQGTVRVPAPQGSTV